MLLQSLLSPFLHRVLSRTTVIQFREPTIGPANEEKEETFTEFEDIISTGTMSSIVGWSILQRKAVVSAEGKEKVLDIKEKLLGVFQGRNLQNWALLLFFVKKVLQCY